MLAAAISTPLAAPVIAAVRLRGGSAASARGAASFVTEAIGTARDTGCSGTIVVRMDSAYYSSAAVQAVRRAGACLPAVIAQLNPLGQGGDRRDPGLGLDADRLSPGHLG